MPVSGGVDDVQDDDQLFAGAVLQPVGEDVGQAGNELFIGSEDSTGTAGGERR